MAAQKVYSITINGLQESIKAVDALNESLSALEQRIKTLESKSINVGAKTSSTSSSSGSKTSTSSLSEEAKLEKQIAQLEEKRVAHSKQIYQNYLAAKDVLAETDKDQKQLAASERLAAKTYTNTISGMKQELADIKSVMQTVDLGDTKELDQMVKRADELNSKLKKIEESYGQFGRNVGNYSSAFDGMQKLSINIGGVTREFNSAREASKTLKNELIGLEAAGSGNTEVANELRSAYYNLQSAMDDATKSSKAMDEAMDYMQSFTAMASVGQGLKGFFGLDDTEIERSIQRLVSLQNVLNGIETLRKQMETSEGLGNMFTKGSDKIDKMVAGLTGAKVATEGLTMGSKVATMAVRGLSMALKGVGIGLALEAINLLVQGIEWVSKSFNSWIKGDADLIKEEKLLDSQLDYTNKKIEERNAELAKAYYQGAISQEELLRGQIEETTKVINDQIKALKEKAALEGGNFAENLSGVNYGKKISMDVGGGSVEVHNLEELTELWKRYSEAVLDGKDAMTKLSDETGDISDWFKSFFYTLDDTKDDLVEIGQVAIGEFLNKYEHAMKTMVIDTKEGEKELEALKKQMNDNEMLRTIFMNLDQYVPVESFRKRIQQIINLINGVKTEMGEMETRTVEQVLRSEQLKIDAMKEGAEKRQAQRDLDKKKELQDATLTAEDKANIEKKYQQRKIKEEKEANKKSQNETKKNNREILEAEKDLGNLRIANMKEGLNKVLKQLEEERKQRLAKVEADGRLVGERQAEINKLYDKKVIDTKRKWAEDVRQTYRTMWDNIYAYSFETTSKIAELTNQSVELGQQNTEFARSTKDSPYRISPENSSYGIQGANQLSKGTQIELQIQEQNNKELAKTYNERIDIIKKFWEERIGYENQTAHTVFSAQTQLENERYQSEKRAAAAHSEDLHQQASKALEEGKLTQEEYNEILERNIVEHQNRVQLLDKDHQQKLQQINIDGIKKMQNIYAESYRERLQELRDFQTAVANLESKQPVFNSWGIINLSETKKNNENLLDSYRKLSTEIVDLKRKLQTDLDNNKISFDDFQQANRELDSFADSVGQKMDAVKYELSLGAQIGSFIQSINEYVQAGLQAVQTVMQAINDYQDYEFDKQQEALDKENEMIQEQLDKQQDIVQEHKDNINSIEDELATSRGDRRQHLIDQLNAEIEAQRAAHKEEQRIQKQKEANEKKQEQLEKKRKEAEYKRNLMSIIVSTAMAAANGLATQPFVPVGIAMGALATTLGMVQYALASAQKPYAKGGQLDGGVAVGNRHRDGGIKVLGGRAEIEGGEFITNRISTQMNAPLLEFINSKKKKIDAADLMEFYSSGSVKKNIAKVRTKFEDGGYVPTLPNSLDVRDQLQNIIINQDNRPIYVSVVDINNKQEQVRQVQTLAGLSND